MAAAEDPESLLAEWANQAESLQDTVHQYILRQNELVSKLQHQLQRQKPRPSLSSCSTLSSRACDVEGDSEILRSGESSKEQSGLVSDCQADDDVPAAQDTNGAPSGRRMLRSNSATSLSSSLGTSNSATSLSVKPKLKRTRTQQRLEALAHESASSESPMQRHVAAFVIWWASIEEPPRSGLVKRFVYHPVFDKVVALVIIANTLYTAYQSNYEMEKLGESPADYQIVECAFLGFYMLELAAKLFVHRLYYWLNEDMCWNIFDTLLVMIGLSDIVLMLVGTSFGNVTFARSLRLFKVGKILRIFRALRFLKALRVMIESIAGSFVSLFWSFIMIGMILFVFSLLFVQQMTVILSETDSNTELWQQQRHFFGSVEQASLTLFESTMGGLDWDLVHRLIEPLGAMYTAAFIFYIAFFNFAVMNILTGIFVENAMKLCKPDEEEIVAEQRQKDARDMEEVKRLAGSIDADGSGSIKKDEFLMAVHNQEFVTCFAALGIDVADGDAFFKKVARSDYENEIDVDDFARRIMQARVNASSLDLHGLVFQLQQGLEQMQGLHRRQSMTMHKIASEFSQFVPAAPSKIGL